MARIGDEARLWSRRGTNLTSRFLIPQGLVLDGELVVYVDGMPDFGALQSRETAQRPATYMAFDVLAANGIDIRKLPWSKRRKNLETLASAWEPPIELGMVTYDLDEAHEWFDVMGELGVEGLVAKGQSTRYLPGTSSGWLKVRSVGVVGVRSVIHRPFELVSASGGKEGLCATSVAHESRGHAGEANPTANWVGLRSVPETRTCRE